MVAQGTFRARIHIGPVERLRAPMLLQTTFQRRLLIGHGERALPRLFLVIYGCAMIGLRG